MLSRPICSDYEGKAMKSPFDRKPSDSVSSQVKNYGISARLNPEQEKLFRQFSVRNDMNGQQIIIAALAAVISGFPTDSEQSSPKAVTESKVGSK